MDYRAILKRIVKPLTGRKVRTALATVIAAYVAQSGLDASEETVYTIISVGVAVILGIGIEDAGQKASGNPPPSA
jgi:hypothetical protein